MDMTLPRPLVRPAQPRDFPAIEALTVAVYLGEGYSTPDIEPWLRDIAARAAAADLLVAIDPLTDEVLGAVSFMTVGSSFAQIAQDTEAEFRLLAVAAKARRRGTGDALVRAAIERGQGHGCTQLVLSTQPSMTAAQRLYERLGFRHLPERDWQTPSGSQRLVYGLTL